MPPPVFLYHVVGDLTLGKPELVEFHDAETVEAAARAIAGCSEGAIPVWRRRVEGESRAARFVGMLNSLDLVGFVARVGDQEKAMRTPVAEVVRPNNSLLKEVDPGTRLIDALDMMKQGVRCLLVRKSIPWKGMSKRFSVIYNGKWLKSPETALGATSNSSKPSSSSLYNQSKFCCLSREDVVRFLIGCLGALAPIPLTSVSVLGGISPKYTFVDVSSPAMEAIQKLPPDSSYVAVVETTPDGLHRIIGEISAYKLWKCDHLAAAWAMANLSAGQFVMGADDNNSSPRSAWPEDTFSKVPQIEDSTVGVASRPRKFSSRNIGFFNKSSNMMMRSSRRNMYRGRSAPLTCKDTSTLAAVMAQLLSHRATHVWVTEADSDDILVGVVSFTEILHAVTTNPSSITAAHH